MTAGIGNDDDDDDDDEVDHCYRRQQEILASGMIDLQNINNNLQSQLETTRQTLRETQIRKVLIFTDMVVIIPPPPYSS